MRNHQGCTRRTIVVVGAAWVFVGPAVAAKAAKDNTLTGRERREGWILLFDGKTLNGWTTDEKKPSQRPVEENSINPHKCGAYMMIHEKQWSDFVLSLDFKIRKGCNSGIFVRTYPLTPK